MIHTGLYYILGEEFSPSRPGNAIPNIKEIVQENGCSEIILAFRIDGRLQYVKLMLKELQVQITHLGVGIPVRLFL